MSELTNEQKYQALFMNLVLSLQQAAWFQLGKVPNPVTNKIERDLLQARYSIDLLDMLFARTKGNLFEEETRMLDHVLRELKLNYVDEMDKEKKQPEAAASTAAGETPESSSTTDTQEQTTHEH